MQTEKLSIRLPLDMARMVRREVEEGGYASDSELIGEALRQWQQRRAPQGKRLGDIRASLEEAAASPIRIDADEVRAHFDRLLEETEKTSMPSSCENNAGSPAAMTS